MQCVLSSWFKHRPCCWTTEITAYVSLLVFIHASYLVFLVLVSYHLCLSISKSLAIGSHPGVKQPQPQIPAPGFGTAPIDQGQPPSQGKPAAVEDDLACR